MTSVVHTHVPLMTGVFSACVQNIRGAAVCMIKYNIVNHVKVADSLVECTLLFVVEDREMLCLWNVIKPG